MTTVLLLVLLGAVRWSTSHLIYAKEPVRVSTHGEITRLPYDDWRPVREAQGPGLSRHIGHPGLARYPIYHKGYSYSPSKKVAAQQISDQSENLEVFSPAPPTILGSFSVFGHATVNAREHASHITKKSPRPQLTQDYPQYDLRPKINGYQLRHQYVSPTYGGYTEPPKRPQKYNDYGDQAYYFDASLRPPPREINNKASAFTQHAQSTSLTPNTYYYEQPSPFQASGVDHSYFKARKPNKPILAHNAYRLPSQSQTVFPTISPVDPYRSSGSNEYDHPSSLSYFNNGYNKHNKNQHQQNDNYFLKNPFGDINLSTRRPEQNIVKPVTEEKEPNKDVYHQYSHLGRPFQSSQPYTTVSAQKDVQTFAPFITTYPSLENHHNVKFSDVAQPFQINDYQTQGPPLPMKSDYIVTQQPFTQDVYPITVTTIDVPSEPYQEPKKVHKGTESPFIQSKPSRPYKPYESKPSSYESFPNHKPQVEINSYQGYNDDVPPPFLPTPSPDVVPYISEPVTEEPSTQTPELTNEGQDYNVISTVDSKYQVNTDIATESPTTTIMTETTTRYRPPKRRRPSRPTQTRNDLTANSKLKNHRLNEEVSSTTADYYKNQRRRKPSKYREGSEFKRQRTSTTTTTSTPKPELYEPTEQYDYTTILADDAGQFSRNQNVFNRHRDEDYINNYDQYNSKFPLSDVQIPENEPIDHHYEDTFQHIPSSTSTTTTATTTTTTTTTSTTTPSPPISVTTPTVESATNSVSTKLKNKYGNNRPRFSVKDYRERLNRATSTASPTPDEEEPPKAMKDNKNENVKYAGRIRNPAQTRPSFESTTIAPENSESTTESKFRKYKSRVGPSRYKTSTTSQPENIETTTTERVNTFRPSTNRYKPGTGKYYSRYRTSTIGPKEVDDSPVTTARVTIKPKGVFSAKRRPFPMKPKLSVNKIADEDSSVTLEENENEKFGDSLKMNEVFPDVMSKKMDDASTTTISNGEETNLKPSSIPNIQMDPTSAEAMRIADLTSSSSNDYHTPSVFKGVTSSSRRTVSKITLPTDEPILPLEAFFQTHHSKK